MKTLSGAFLLNLAMLSFAQADGTPLPRDVQRYIQAAESCQHFAGEWDSGMDKRERKRIERNVDRYCASAKKQWDALNAKYRGTPAMRDVLAEHRCDAVLEYRRR